MKNLTDKYIGKYVIIRSGNEGINAGFLKAADATGVVLKKARRLWYHKPSVVTECWYEGVANHGLSEDSRISAPVKVKVIIEDYSITPCTGKATKSIQAAKPHAQS